MATLLLLPLLRRLESRRSKFTCFVSAAALGILPFGATDVSGFILAHTGALSSTMLLLLGWRVLAELKLVSTPSVPDSQALTWGVVLFGVLLYPSALGFFTFDSYRLGFSSSFGISILALSAIAALRSHMATAICLAMAVLSWRLQLQESVNLWDYLIDPCLCFWSSTQIVVNLYQRIRKRLHQDTQNGINLGAS